MSYIYLSLHSILENYDRVLDLSRKKYSVVYIFNKIWLYEGHLTYKIISPETEVSWRKHLKKESVVAN